MTRNFKRILGGTSAIGLAIMLSACEPDGSGASSTEDLSLLSASGPLDWPMDGNESGFLSASSSGNADWAPLAAAAPMVRTMPASYDNAPHWDYPREYVPDDGRYAGYAPDDSYGYDDEYGFASGYEGEYGYGSDYWPANDYYDPSPSSDSYAFLALAAILGGMIGESPPDYYFQAGGVQPWVWETGDRYVRYAEPISSGYRYYYYAPGAARPFLVRDPYYSYGYRNDRLAVVYDTNGYVLTSSRAMPLRRAAATYYDRGETLYRASLNTDRYGVSAPLWQKRRTAIVADQNNWNRARVRNDRWQNWDRKYDRAGSAHWKSERIARHYAAERYDTWQADGFRSAAPRVRQEVRSRPQVDRKALTRAVIASRRDDRQGLIRQASDARPQRVAQNRAEERLSAKSDRRDLRRLANENRPSALQRQSLTRDDRRGDRADRPVRAQQVRTQERTALREQRQSRPEVRKASQPRAQERTVLRQQQAQPRQERGSERASLRQQRDTQAKVTQQRAQERSALRQARQTREPAKPQRAQERKVVREQREARPQVQRQQRSEQRTAMRQQRQSQAQVQQRSEQRTAMRQQRPQAQQRVQERAASRQQQAQAQGSQQRVQERAAMRQQQQGRAQAQAQQRGQERQASRQARVAQAEVQQRNTSAPQRQGDNGGGRQQKSDRQGKGDR